MLVKLGRVRPDASDDEVAAEYSRYARDRAGRPDRDERDRKQVLVDQVATPLRRQLTRLGINWDGMSVDEMRAKVDQVELAQQAIKAQQAADRRRARVSQLFASARCPLRHALDLDRVEASAARECPRWIVVRDLLVAQAQYANGYLVALLGNRGVGKTELVTSVVRRCCSELLTCRYVKAADLFRDVRRAYAQVGRGERALTEADVVESWVQPDLLVIDECHQRGETDAEQNLLINLIDRRYDAMTCTVLVGNQSKEEFGAALGDSVVSRIHQMGEPIVCDWPSFRRPGEWRQGGNAPRRVPSGLKGLEVRGDE